MKNRETNKIFTDKFRMFFLDLLAFDKKNEDECETNLDNWIYSIKYSGNMSTRPRMANSSPIFNKLYSMAELAAMTTRQRNQYEVSLKRHWDMLADQDTTRNRIKRAHTEGLVEGRAEGETIGIQKATIANAHKMIEAGFPIEKVLEILGLTAEDLQ